MEASRDESRSLVASLVAILRLFFCKQRRSSLCPFFRASVALGKELGQSADRHWGPLPPKRESWISSWEQPNVRLLPRMHAQHVPLLLDPSDQHRAAICSFDLARRLQRRGSDALHTRRSAPSYGEVESRRCQMELWTGKDFALETVASCV